jgi:NAD(P)-dependent dehydrogenase (short-subunit alcohol dehydrogenase family)
MMLSGRTIVIIGAARGVGTVIAESCARNQARFILCDILVEQGEETAVDLAKAGASVRFAPIDLANQQSIAAFAAQIAGTEVSFTGWSTMQPRAPRPSVRKICHRVAEPST